MHNEERGLSTEKVPDDVIRVLNGWLDTIIESPSGEHSFKKLPQKLTKLQKKFEEEGIFFHMGEVRYDSTKAQEGDLMEGLYAIATRPDGSEIALGEKASLKEPVFWPSAKNK